PALQLGGRVRGARRGRPHARAALARAGAGDLAAPLARSSGRGALPSAFRRQRRIRELEHSFTLPPGDLLCGAASAGGPGGTALAWSFDVRTALFLGAFLTLLIGLLLLAVRRQFAAALQPSLSWWILAMLAHPVGFLLIGLRTLISD